MRRQVDGTTLRLIVTGEVDLASRDVVADAIEQALREGPALLFIDVGAVTFIDSTGVGVLIAGWKAAKALRVAFRVVEVRGLVARVLGVIGVLESLTGQAAGNEAG